VGGDEVVGLNSGAVHEWVAVLIAALARVGGRGAGGQDTPVEVVVSRAFLGDRGAAGVARFLHAEEEGEPIGNILSVCSGCVVVLNGAILPHVAVAFASSMLASEGPSSISTLLLVGISVGVRHEKHNFSNALESRINLGNGVFFTSRAQRFTVQIHFHRWVCLSRSKANHKEQKQRSHG